MKYFWTHKDNIPDGKGYGQFTREHFILIILTALLVAATTFFYQYSDHSHRILILRVIGATLILIDIIKLFVLPFSNVKVTDYLPLEICSFGAYSIVCDSIWYDNSFFSILLITLFLPAALMAVVFPTTSSLPALNFYSIHQFLYHGLIIAYITARFLSGEMMLSYPEVWLSILKILVLVGFMYVFDTVFKKNYMFLKDPYGNPMLNILWKAGKGSKGYTLVLVCFSIIVINIFYFFFKLIEIIFIK